MSNKIKVRDLDKIVLDGVKYDIRCSVIKEERAYGKKHWLNDNMLERGNAKRTFVGERFKEYKNKQFIYLNSSFGLLYIGC